MDDSFGFHEYRTTDFIAEIRSRNDGSSIPNKFDSKRHQVETVSVESNKDVDESMRLESAGNNQNRSAENER